MPSDINVPKYPQVVVKLMGEDGNAFAIMGKVQREMKRAHLTPEQVQEYIDEATAGDYDNLLRVTLRYVAVE